MECHERTEWPPHSPDVTPLGSSLRTPEIRLSIKPCTIEHLKNVKSDVIAKKEPDETCILYKH